MERARSYDFRRRRNAPHRVATLQNQLHHATRAATHGSEGLMNIAVGILTDIVHFIRLIIFAVLDILGVVIRPVLAGLGLLGFAMCGFYALVVPKSHFPHAQMLAIATGF